MIADGPGPKDIRICAMSFEVYNSLTRQKEVFQPLEPGVVRMYNCGPTVYSRAHIGNFRAFLFADLLRRWLEHSGLVVRQVMNVTDVGHLTDEMAGAGEDRANPAERAGEIDRVDRKPDDNESDAGPLHPVERAHRAAGHGMVAGIEARGAVAAHQKIFFGWLERWLRRRNIWMYI